MYEAVFGNEVNDTMLGRDLHRDWEVVGRFRWEVNVDRLFSKYGISRIVIDLNDVKLWTIIQLTPSQLIYAYD